MRARRLHHFTFALALLLGQLLSFAHGFEHRALAPDSSCQLCLHAQGLDSGAITPTAAVAAVVDAAIEAPLGLPDRPARLVPVQLYQARAPPTFLV